MFQQREPIVTPEQQELENARVQRQPYIEPTPEEPPEPDSKVALFAGADIIEPQAPVNEQWKARHNVLMSTLEEEGERQQEERHQAQIDDDYYHHLQWTAKDAAELAERGQAPLVYNESRATIDWLCGTERKMRKDYKIRPREETDTNTSELKTKLMKYTDDVNMAPWHRSKAAKAMFTSGLGWLEEGINPDPDREMVFSGSEDWRRVFRDSRAREFDLSDARYLHRRKIIDLDYATFMLPSIADHLKAVAGRWGADDDESDETWYLGEKLTNASLSAFQNNISIIGGGYSVRSTGATWDRGRRNTVELIETYYRVPERVEVFNDGPHFRKVFNPADPRHVTMKQQGISMYQTVKMRMRVMVGTKYQPAWDGVSPFQHGRFSLIPMWGYRRGRDGVTYGAMRGMRDPQDSLNKRKSKALHALNSNRVVAKASVVDDIEELRQEAARADGVILIDGAIEDIRFEKFQGEVQQNLEMAQEDAQHIKNAGGVTGENLGQRTNAASGKAIMAKQEQGSMTSFELFDNYLLAFKLAGQQRLANIEQFCNQPWVVRIDPNNKPEEWVRVNEVDPLTGQIKNDITKDAADFIVAEQDYRATLTMAAMDSMFELLQSIAVFAPQVVLNLLDLAVDTADIPSKEEWVTRIRKLNGQRDPTKPPTPEQQAADEEAAADEKRMKKTQMETLDAQLALIRSKVTDTNAASVMKNLQGLLSAVEAAAAVVTMPGVAAAADGLAQSGGFVDATPHNPIIAAPEQIAAPVDPAVDPAQQQLPPEAQPGAEQIPPDQGMQATPEFPGQ